MTSPLLPPGRADGGGRPRPAPAPRLAMGAVTLAALLAAAWAAVLALTAAEPFSCALTSEDTAAIRCNQAAGRFADLSPAAVLLLLLPPAAGVALGWWGVLRGSPGRGPSAGDLVADGRREAGGGPETGVDGTEAGGRRAAAEGPGGGPAAGSENPAAGGRRAAFSAWGWVAAGGVLVLGGLAGCALLWTSLVEAVPEL